MNDLPTRYCTTCRKRFRATTPAPPYSAKHVTDEDGTVTHIDIITHELLVELEPDVADKEG
jgi:hypothetical protein